MAQEDAQKSVTFTAYKRQRIVDAQMDGDAVAFYKAVFDAVETGHSLHHKRKADQELPHLVSSELELAGTTVVVSDVSLNYVSERFCLKGFDLYKAEWFAECLDDPVTPTLPPDDLEALDLYTANWYADCFNDPETPTQHDDLTSGSPKVQIDVSEYLNVSPETETWEVRRPVTRSSPNVIFRGMKSFQRPVTKLSSSISYPFTLIKPCGVHGDMTLKDINEKIRTPAANPKEDKAEPPVIQTSLFSGKPVVGKTKFRTEGGNGTITVMRTRG